MQSSLDKLSFEIGYLKLSEKRVIAEILRAETEKQQHLLKTRGVASSSAFSELQTLVNRLFKLYTTEKSFEGTDRLFAASHELGQLLRDVGLFARFEQMVLRRFRSHYEQKSNENKTHEFYVGKAEALMEGLGDETLKQFRHQLDELRIRPVSEVQPELGARPSVNGN